MSSGTNKQRIAQNNAKITELRQLVTQKAEGNNYDVTKGLADGTLTEFSAPNYGITTLAPRRFSGFTNLTKLDLTGITNIPKYTANNCNNLEELVLDSNLVEVGQYAFQLDNTNELFDLELQFTNANIGARAFSNRNVTKLIGSFTNIGQYAFSTTRPDLGLKTLKITVNGIIDNYAFGASNYLSEFELTADSVITKLGNNAFYKLGENRLNKNTVKFYFNFTNSTFTDIPQQCFSSDSTSAKITNVQYKFNNKVLSIKNDAFRNSENIQIYWSSVPMLAGINVFASNTNYKNFFPYQLAHTAKTATNWSSSTYGIVDSIYGYAEAGTFTLNETLPNTDADGYALTWYSDEDLTQEVSIVTDADAIYYCIVGECAHVLLDITSLQANVVVSDGTTNYTNGSLVPIGANLTITAIGQGANTQKYMFELNNVDISSGDSYTVGAVDISIVCIYWDGVNLPVNENFADNTPTQIKLGIDNGLHRILWTVGDTKTIELTDGTQATVRLTDTIANRYEKTDGSGYTNGVLEFTTILKQAQMNTSNTNAGGWPATRMNTVTMGEIYDLLPAEWQQIASEVKIGSATSGNDSTIVYANNKCFLASAQEIYNSYTSYAYDEGGQIFEYYNGTGDSTKIKQYNGSNQAWWLRSPCRGISIYFCLVSSSGSFNYYTAGDSSGVSAFIAI